MFNELIMARNSEMFRQLKSSPPADIVDFPDRYKYIHLIHLKNDPGKILHLHGSSTEIERENLSFDQLFHKIKPQSFSDCLLLLSLIGHISYEEIQQLFEEDFNNSHLLTNVIIDSNGVLVYRHQLEMLLYIFTKMNAEEVAQFRRHWNRKSHSVIALSKDILINETQSLFDLIMERTPFRNYPFFISASYREAYQLFKFVHTLN